jgi:competence protein ComEC
MSLLWEQLHKLYIPIIIKSNYIHKRAFEKPHVLSLVVREKLKARIIMIGIFLINQVDGEKRSGRLLLNVRKDSLNHQLKVLPFTLKELFIKINPPTNIQNQLLYKRVGL